MIEIGDCAMTSHIGYFASATAPAARLAPVHSLGRYVGTFLNRLAEWQDRAEQRTHLAGMDDRMLKDIGINGVDAARESGKPFWKA
jgi:uncharacterized protein YjiS (DUF1127 family)